VPEVARSLGLSDQSGRWAVANLSNYLADRQLLLVIDQCEHLADACAVLADALLRACPGLRVIATSRHMLGVAGEVTVAVPPMTIPSMTIPTEGGNLLRYEAAKPASRSAVLSTENQPRLTQREQDVAALVARGLSNGQIAATLVISARTVETHVEHIMDKLGVSTRAQIAAWAAENP